MTTRAEIEAFREFVAQVAPELHWEVWRNNSGENEPSHGGYDGYRHGFGKRVFGPGSQTEVLNAMKRQLEIDVRGRTR